MKKWDFILDAILYTVVIWANLIAVFINLHLWGANIPVACLNLMVAMWCQVVFYRRLYEKVVKDEKGIG